MADIANFERTIIKGLIKGIDVRASMARLTEDHFETAQLRPIFGAINQYYKIFNEIPEVDALTNEIRKTTSKEINIDNAIAFVIKEEQITEDRFRYAFEEVSNNFISRGLRTTMKEAILYLDAGDPRKAQDVLMAQTAVLAAHGKDVKVIDFVSDFGTRKTDLINRRDHPELFRHFFVPTGIERLDAQLDGGLRRGELGIFLAPPESGKSISLQDITVSAVLNGFKAALITIEMTPEQTAYRLDARLTQFKYRKFRRADMDEAEVKEWESQVSRMKENCLKIIGVPEGCSCRLIEAELSRMKNSFRPDVIAVDYAGIMAPNGGSGKYDSSLDWKYIGEIVRNLKGLALKLNIPVWTASQLLVGAKEKAEVKFVDVGLARQQIAAHADICVAIIQTAQMRAMEATKLQLVKVREGCDERMVEIVSDFDRISLERKTMDQNAKT